MEITKFKANGPSKPTAEKHSPNRFGPKTTHNKMTTMIQEATTTMTTIIMMIIIATRQIKVIMDMVLIKINIQIQHMVISRILIQDRRIHLLIISPTPGKNRRIADS